MSGNAYEVNQADYGSFGGTTYGAPVQQSGYGAAPADNGYGQTSYGGNSYEQPRAAPVARIASAVKSLATDGSIINSRDSPNNTKMFVGGISKNTTTASLRAYFDSFGPVRDVEIKVDPATGSSRGFGFVLFEAEEAVNSVCNTHEHYLDGKKIDPKRAEKRNAKIFVGGLKSDCTDELIQEVFGQYGEIELFERRMDKNKGTPQAFCFITFKDDSIAQSICKGRWVDVGDKRAECKLAVENKEKLAGGGFQGGPGQGQGQSWGGPGGFQQRGGGAQSGGGRGGGQQSWGGGQGPYSGGSAWGAGWGPQGGNPYGGYGQQGGGQQGGGQQGGGQGYGGRGGYGARGGGDMGGPPRGGGPMRGRGRGRPTPY